MKNMHEMAKQLDKFLKIIFYAIIAAVLIMVGFAAVSLCFGEVTVQKSVNLGLITLGVTDAILPDSGIFTISMILNYLYYILMAVPFCIGIFMIRNRILLPIQKGKPFSAGISRELKKLGTLTLIFGGLSSFAKYVLETISLSTYDITGILQSENITEITYNVTLSLSFLFIALILYFLSFIFKYGEQLQTQVDETL